MKFRVDTSEIANAARVIAGAPEELRKANRRTLFKAGERGVQTIRRKYRMAGQTTRTATASRTGALADAYAYELGPAEGQQQTLDVGVIRPGTDAKTLAYARVHEHRGTTIIKPKRAKYLAIPLDDAKTARGVARGGPRDFADTFVKRSKAGNLVIYQDRADQIVPLFVLVRSVRVKGRPALRPTAKEQIMPEIQAGVEKNFEASFAALGR
jgi:hypothetical protein